MPKVEILKQNGFNFLWIDNCLWMWDIPVEQRAQKQIANQAYGDVLVAGYGLGVVQRYLSKNPKVTSITTVEKLSAVIKESKKAYGKIYGQVVIKDFYRYKSKNKFDCVIGDVWADILPEGLGQYRKFEKKAKLLVRRDGKVLAWGQDFFKALE